MFITIGLFLAVTRSIVFDALRLSQVTSNKYHRKFHQSFPFKRPIILTVYIFLYYSGMRLPLNGLTFYV